MLKRIALPLLFGALLTVGTVHAQDATETAAPTDLPDRVTIEQEGLMPEGVVYDPVNARFLVSSVAEGTVYAVADDGTLTPFVVDERIPSSFGLEVDAANNRLLVVATEVRLEGYLGIYDLTTGDNLAWVDLRPAKPNPEGYFPNDVTVDAAGNAYVTDSIAGVFYRVDAAGTPTLFLEDDSFTTNLALNGLVYHAEENALLAVRVPGLIRIPLDNPEAFTEIEIGTPIPGADGVALLDERTLLVVSNVQGRVYRIESSDGFASGFISGVFDTGHVFPSTITVRDGAAYVLYAQLDADIVAPTTFPIQRATFAPLTQ